MQPKETPPQRTPESRVPPAVPPKQDAKPQDRDWYERMKDQMEGASAGSEAPGAQKKAEKEKQAEDKKEKNVVIRMWTSFADCIRDLDTASKMAESEFGENGLFHLERGVLNMAVGSLFEKATDSLWNKMFQGRQELFERFRVGSDVAEKLSAFTLDPNQRFHWKARLAYLMKEGTQDLVIGGLHNSLLGFRMNPLFDKVEAKHLLRSLKVDALEALLSPSVPQNAQWVAAESLRDMDDAKTKDLDFHLQDLVGKQRYDKEGKKLNDMTQWIEEVKFQKEQVNEHYETIPDVDYMDPSDLERFVRGVTNFSNPVTQLGLDMIVASLGKIRTNYNLVHNVRKAKGIKGKRVEMPKEDKGRYGDRRAYGDRKPYGDGKPYSDRKPYQERKQDYQKKEYPKKVYQSRWQKPLTPEEEFEKFE